MKKLKKYIIGIFCLGIISIFCLGIISGCEGSLDQFKMSKTDINGEIKNGRYFDPEKRFSIKVPELLQPGAVIRGHFGPSGGTIGFSDDLGTLVRIDVSTALTQEAKSIVQNPNWEQGLSSYRDNIASSYQYISPKTKPIESEFTSWQMHNAICFTCFIPEGSTIANTKSNKRCDAYRMTIAFVHGNSYYAISSQHTKGGVFDDGSSEKEILKNMKKKLFSILDTLTLN